MLIIPKNNKRFNLIIEEIVKNITNVNITINIGNSNKISSPEYDEQLLKYYKNVGFKDYQLEVSHKLITDMPFNKTINLDFMKKNKNYKTYKILKGCYELSNYGIKDKMLNTCVPYVKLDRTVEVPMICEDDIGWMAPVLFEENTMKGAVAKAQGSVLTFGLGIGFFQFNCLLKESVTKVTVIEKNKDIIELFNQYILPQFPRKDIEIIEGDAYCYCNNEYIKQFDYTFVDIWRNNSDGVLALSRLFKNLDFSKQLNIDFWVEDTILDEVKTSVAIYIIQKHRGNLEKLLTGKITEKEDEEDFITFDKINRYFKKNPLRIKNSSDLIEALNDKDMLRDMLKSF